MKKHRSRRLLRESVREIDELVKTGNLNIEGKTFGEILAIAAVLACFVIDSCKDPPDAKATFLDMIDLLTSLRNSK